MEQKRCDKHDYEIMEIKTEFGHFKKEVSAKLDELFEEIRKPIFTDKQVISIIIGICVYLVIAVSYVNKIDARSIENYNTTKENKQTDKEIIKMLIDIKETVDRNEGKNNSK